MRLWTYSPSKSPRTPAARARTSASSCNPEPTAPSPALAGGEKKEKRTPGRPNAGQGPRSWWSWFMTASGSYGSDPSRFVSVLHLPPCITGSLVAIVILITFLALQFSGTSYRPSSSIPSWQLRTNRRSGSNITSKTMAAIGYKDVVLHRPKVILFGDSLTERSMDAGGWGAAMAHNFTRRADVVVRGFGGYNTRWALQLMPEVFNECNREDLMLVTLFFGANDAALPDGHVHSIRQHVPLPEYKANLAKMVEYVRGLGVTRILMITPPPVYHPGRIEFRRQRFGEAAVNEPIDRTNEHAGQYAAACCQVAGELGLPCVDVWTELQKHESWGSRLLCDGLHFTPEGQQQLWQMVKAKMDEAFPDIKPELLNLHFPDWQNIDTADPTSLPRILDKLRHK